MTVDIQQRPRRGKLWLAAALVALVLALVVVPPLIGINRYKSRITQLVSASLGRPVRISGVELRLLPRPGFLISDLTVEEDPAFGAEPVLHADSVVASIRFASLWRGKLQISRISVEDASLNLVRSHDGRWNIDSLFRSAVADSESRRTIPRPYLEATTSRINIKNGLEKLPFSLLNADAALWQESDGTWRVRLEGQPARTDVTLELGDTGIVRLEGTLRPAPQFSRMPVHLDAEWRDGQLGQLSRLLLRSDQGWRGDLHGELHVDGTADTAHVQARLRAAGVHREEFAPVAPLDFDAACALVFHYPSRSVEGLDCSSPVGDGRAHLTGSIPPAGQPLRLALDLDRIPAQAGLDVLRTVRRNVDESLQAAGTLSGHLAYDPAAAIAPLSPTQPHKGAGHTAPAHLPAGPLAGSLTLNGLSISGDSLSHPITVPRVNLEPAPPQPGEPAALVASFTVAAGGPAPLAVKTRLALNRFEVGLRGPASLAGLREFAHYAGGSAQAAFNQLAGEPASIELDASGPWLAPVEVTLGTPAAPPVPSIHSTGAITFHDANWKPAWLANAVLIHQATLHVEDGALKWDPVEFSFGPVKGSATLALPAYCAGPADCPPQFTAHFSALDTAEVESALLGAQQKGTLLSSLLDRFNPTAAPKWPGGEGTVQIDSLLCGPLTATAVGATLKISGSSVAVTALNASLLGGNLNGTANFQAGDKPQYVLEAKFTALKPALLGALLGMKWTGGDFDGSGKLTISGFTGKDLAASASGSVDFDWSKGGIKGPDVPAALAAFDKLSGSAEIAGGALTVNDAKLTRGTKSSAIHAVVTLSVPHKVTFPSAKH